jgi:signal peptidase I
MEIVATPSNTMTPTIKNQNRIASAAASYTAIKITSLPAIVSHIKRS